MTERPVFQRIGAYYDALVRQHGHSPRACDYGRPESQAAKFDVLSQAADMKGKRVLDIGCGFADYADYLDRKFDGVSYTGIDISQEMVAGARERHPALDIRLLNVLDENPGTFDIVTANGIFYLLGDDAWALMQRFIARMFELSKQAVSFNSLSDWAPDKEAKEFYADPAKTLSFCRTLTPWVTLRHDYHPRDFTVYMYHSAPPR